MHQIFSVILDLILPEHRSPHHHHLTDTNCKLNPSKEHPQRPPTIISFKLQTSAYIKPYLSQTQININCPSTILSLQSFVLHCHWLQPIDSFFHYQSAQAQEFKGFALICPNQTETPAKKGAMKTLVLRMFLNSPRKVNAISIERARAERPDRWI
jgi:hypothetical protein